MGKLASPFLFSDMTGTDTNLNLPGSFLEGLHKSRWYQPGVSVLCACSGGVDSTVLAHLLAGDESLQLGILHINHGMRGSAADEDAAFVAALAESLHCRSHFENAHIPSVAAAGKLSLEEAGHRVRRQLYHQIKENGGYDVVVTGHTADDQVELLLLNLYSGTGIKGLAGMSTSTGWLQHPLLDYRKVDLSAYARSRQINHVEDATNKELNFRRNQVRHQLMPILNEKDRAMDKLTLEIVRSAKSLKTLLDDSIYVLDNEHLKRISKSKLSFVLPEGTLYFSAVLKEFFDNAFIAVSTSEQGLSRRHFNDIEKLIHSGEPGSSLDLPANVVVARDRRHLVFYQRGSLDWEPADLSIPVSYETKLFTLTAQIAALPRNIQDLKRPEVAWIPAETAGFNVAKCVSGDQMHPIGTPRLSSAADLMSAAGVAPHLRPYFPIVSVNGAAVWIPGVCADQQIEIDPAWVAINKRLVRLQIEYKEEIFE